MADERAVYPDSSRRSEQLSCTKFFIRATVYFILILKGLNHFYDLFNYFNATLSRLVFADVIMMSA